MELRHNTYIGANHMRYTQPFFTWTHRFLKWIIVCTTAILLIGIGIYTWSFLLGPPPLVSEQNTIYYSHDEEVIGEEKGLESRYWVDLDKIPEQVIQATIAIEDKRFYDHHGFDLKRIAKAVVTDISNLTLKEGASTLTQQYSRNLYLTHDKKWSRKLKEALYTVRLEMHYSKEELLEGYLNTIYFGHGAYGIEAASRLLFHKHADELSLAEATTLVAIPKGPTYYSPLHHPENSKRRQKQILSAMQQEDMISEEEQFLAAREHLVFEDPLENEQQVIGPYFQDTVLQEARGILNIDVELIKSGGYQIYTTLQTDLQKQLEDEITRQIDKESDIEIGALAMHPHTGEIGALVGGMSYEKSPYNRVTQAKRMSGSTFKPFLYYAALNRNYTASTKLMSQPTSFVLEDEEVYQPRNYHGYYANDSITLAQALALSDNVYAVKTNLFLGEGVLAETAQDFGISGELPAVPSLALGTASVSIKEMVKAYGMLANGGHEVDEHTIVKIIDRHGKVVFERDQQTGEAVLDQQTSFILTKLMTGMFDQKLNGYMDVTGASMADQLTRPYAGKSGTTDGDSWMIGYSPTLVTGVWTGYDDNRPIEVVSEAASPKKIWAGFMETAHHDQPQTDFAAPPGVVKVQVDPESGQLATPYCPSTKVMYFKKGTEPTDHCHTHFPEGEKELEPDNDQKRKVNDGVFQRLFDLFTN